MKIAAWAAAMETRDWIAQNFHKTLIKIPWLWAPFWEVLHRIAEPAFQVRGKKSIWLEMFFVGVLEINAVTPGIRRGSDGIQLEWIKKKNQKVRIWHQILCQVTTKT